MTTKTPPNNDGILSFLNSILKNSATASGSDRQVSPEEVAILGASIKIVAEEVKSLARSVELLLTAVEQQNSAINELYAVQEFVLKQMKDEVDEKMETQLAAPKKTKFEKPN